MCVFSGIFYKLAEKEKKIEYPNSNYNHFLCFNFFWLITEIPSLQCYKLFDSRLFKTNWMSWKNVRSEKYFLVFPSFSFFAVWVCFYVSSKIRVCGLTRCVNCKFQCAGIEKPQICLIFVLGSWHQNNAETLFLSVFVTRPQ